jgi:hypothetical protein
MAVVVDDVQGTAFGTHDRVVSSTSQACEFFVERFEAQQMPISEPKVQMVGSSQPGLKAVARRCLPLRRAAATSVRHLGADFAAGRRIIHSTRSKRIRNILEKARRLRKLGRFGNEGLRVARTALGPGAMFAVAVTGILPGHRKLVRWAYHMAVVRKPAWRATTIDLALLHPRAVPEFTALVTPIGGGGGSGRSCACPVPFSPRALTGRR